MDELKRRKAATAAAGGDKKPLAKAKAKLDKDGNPIKEEPKEPTEEDLKKLGPSQYKPGTYVEIFGLESGDGKKLNGQKGRVTGYLYEKIRYEVSLGPKTVSCRPVNLKTCEKPDGKWSYGDTCRLVCLREVEDEAVRDANGCMGTLMFGGKAGSWKVIANGKIHAVNCENLRVLTEEEKFIQFGWFAKGLQSMSAVTSLHLCLAVGIVVMKQMAPDWFNMEHPDEDSIRENPLVMILNPTLPSPYVAGLSGAVVCWSFLVLWGTILCCAWMHRPLRDPMTTFTQTAELGIGRASATTLYRLGFGMVACLLFASVMLHKELVIPHLPYVGTAADDVFFWGCVAVVGVALQAGSCVDVSYTWHTLLHRFAMFLVILAAYKHMTSSMALYIPGARTTTSVWLDNLKEYIPDRQLSEEMEAERTKNEQIKNAVEFAANSKFLNHPYVQFSKIARYHVLSYWPLTILMLPVFTSILEHAPENSKVSGSSLLRSMFAWLQWLLTFVVSLIHLSYAPDLIVASMMAIATQSEDS